MSKQYKIVFRYADELSHWEWREQTCVLYANNSFEARFKCVELYGLGKGCDYEFVSVDEA